MSIEYNVSDDGLRIETIPKGELNAEETIDYFNRIKNDKRIRPGAIEVVYFKFVTDFKISYLEGEKITQSYQEPKVLQHIDTTIFICETELAYGIGRMLQIFHEITNPEHKVLLAKSETELNDFIKGNH